MKVPVLVILLAIATAPASAVEPGQEGNLAEFVRPIPGERVCFARDYTAAHLARHPKQRVAAIRFALTYHRHEPDEHHKQGQRNYYFKLDVRFRDRPDKTLSAVGDCFSGNGFIRCGVDCDGGGVRVRWQKRPEQVLIDYGNYYGIRLSACGGEEDDGEDAKALKPGADDKSFLLSRTKQEDCPEYDTW